MFVRRVTRRDGGAYAEDEMAKIAGEVADLVLSKTK
jgi:hypothetical protein